jgi:hypothetical protein
VRISIDIDGPGARSPTDVEIEGTWTVTAWRTGGTGATVEIARDNRRLHQVAAERFTAPARVTIHPHLA